MEWRLSVLLLTGLCPLALPLPQFYFIGTALPWLEALQYCRQHYTDLASVHSTEDMNLLVNTAQDSTGGFGGLAWIGLLDNLTNWRWSLSDNQLFRGVVGNYRNWDFGQPDNFLAEQMCVRMRSGGFWDNTRCFLRYPFVCFDGAIGATRRLVYVSQEMSWPDAQVYCRTSYTDLASIEDENDNQEILQMTRHRSAWIGLFRRREWSDGSTFIYHNWKPGQPHNVRGRQRCTTTHLGNAGLWSVEECSRRLSFICYETNDKQAYTVTSGSMTTEEDLTSSAITTVTSDLDTTSEMTATEAPAPDVDQTTRAPAQEHVIVLRATVTSTKQLSEEEVRALVLEECQRLLREKGLPPNVKIGLRISLK